MGRIFIHVFGEPYAARSLGMTWGQLGTALKRLRRGLNLSSVCGEDDSVWFASLNISAINQALGVAADAWPAFVKNDANNVTPLDQQLEKMKNIVFSQEQKHGKQAENKALSAEFQALAQELDGINSVGGSVSERNWLG